MGGFGSGRWRQHTKKTTVEECLTLSMTSVERSGLFRGRSTSDRQLGSIPWYNRTIGWRSGPECDTVRITAEETLDGLVLHLRYWIAEHPVDLPILLEAARPSVGGQRWWFMCPGSSATETCGRRAAKLYLPPGSLWFGCRLCHDLTYRSCQESHQLDSLVRYTAAIMGRSEESIRPVLAYMLKRSRAINKTPSEG